jgi:hypothetical protein
MVLEAVVAGLSSLVHPDRLWPCILIEELGRLFVSLDLVLLLQKTLAPIGKQNILNRNSLSSPLTGS